MRWLRAVRPSVSRAAVLLSLLIMAAIITPVLVVAAGSFWSAPFIRQAGTLTLDNYKAFLSSPQTGDLLLTTLQMTVGASLLAVSIGGFLAWIVARTNIPLRRYVWWLPMAPLLLSGMLRDTAWIGLYSPNTGLVNLWLMDWLGLSGPVFNIFTLTGVILTFGMTLAPIPYLIMLAPLTSMNLSLEEASRASGASQRYTLRKVTLPLLRPALLSALTISAIIVATAFETPVIIGLPGDVHTFIPAIYSSMSTGLNFSLASAQSMVYLVLMGVLLWWYRRSTRTEARFGLIAGRGHNPGFVDLGRWRYPLLGVVLLHFVVAFLSLLAAALYLSLVPYYTVTEAVRPELTLSNYSFALNAVGTLPSIRSSIVVAGQVAVLCVIAALVLGLVAFKTRFRGRRMAELIGTVPIAFPPLVFSVALLITFLSIPGMQRFYRSTALLLVALVVVFLPFALRVVSSTIISVNDELLEASASAGASMLRTVRSIVVPLLATALISGATIVFVLSFRELGAVALVVPPGMDLMMTQIFNLWFQGQYGAVHALNVVSFLITSGLLLLMYVVVRVLRYGVSRRAARRDLAEPDALVAAARPVETV